MSDDDFMEIDKINLVPTSYGFLNTITGEKLDHDGYPLSEENDAITKEN